MRRVANRPSGFFMSIPEIVDRISYISAFDDNAIIAINDPNFLHDCYLLAYLGMGDLEMFGELFKVRLFCVHRDFHHSRSLLRRCDSLWMVWISVAGDPAKFNACSCIVGQVRCCRFPCLRYEPGDYKDICICEGFILCTWHC